MSIIRDRGENPSGLSTIDPMRHENYRKTVRAISDRFHRLKGIPPLARFEDREPIERRPDHQPVKREFPS